MSVEALLLSFILPEKRTFTVQIALIAGVEFDLRRRSNKGKTDERR
jgi:hypothetical protein